MIVRIAQPAALPSSDLEDWGKVKEPLGEPVAALRGRKAETGPGGPDFGIWECSPGRWRRQVARPEVCVFLSGAAAFEADSGQRFEIAGGDAFYFPANSFGTWIVRETVRKVYLILG